jgi:lipoprotein-releasing system ATP-binding protein
MMKEWVIKARNISKKFLSPTPVSVLTHIDLDLYRGESIAIVGKSGEGKSTLLHILGTLEKPCEGTLEICGLDAASAPLAPLRNQRIGFIFQSCNLMDDYTALDNILMPARIARLPTHKGTPAYEHAMMLIEAVGLQDRVHFLSKFLSGGERQRVAIARALCNDPDLILADEPSGNLDNSHSKQIHSLLIHLAKEFNKSLVVVTHDKELSSLCAKTLYLKDGRLSGDMK